MPSSLRFETSLSLPHRLLLAHLPELRFSCHAGRVPRVPSHLPLPHPPRLLCFGSPPSYRPSSKSPVSCANTCLLQRKQGNLTLVSARATRSPGMRWNLPAGASCCRRLPAPWPGWVHAVHRCVAALVVSLSDVLTLLSGQQQERGSSPTSKPSFGERRESARAGLRVHTQPRSTPPKTTFAPDLQRRSWEARTVVPNSSTVPPSSRQVNTVV